MAIVALTLELVRRYRDRELPRVRALSGLSYAVYLLHYAPVIALCAAMRDWPVHAAAKATLATVGTLALCWAAAAALQRTPARVLVGLLPPDRR